MNILLLKIWNFLKQKNRWLILLVIAIIISQYLMIQLKNKKIAKLEEEVQTEINLNDALHDTIIHYKNLRNEWVAEKLTIQESMKKLEKIYGQLTESQKELIARIKEMDKKNTLIAAALIQTNIKIDSLQHELIKDSETTIDTTKKIINFNNLKSQDSTFKYNIDVQHILPAYSDIRPGLLFKSIEIPNTQFVEFHWKNEKKKGYPIAFSITNTNKYITVTSLDSYAIPPLDKLKLNPTGWQKVENFLIKNGRTILYIGAGVAAGVGGAVLLTP
jgi:hypothetical protein